MKQQKQTMRAKGKYKAVFKAAASGVVWGSGQLFNRQYIKAVFFFIFFAILVGTELGSSHYFSNVSPYDRVAGQEMPSTFAEGFNSYYKTYVSMHLIADDTDYDNYYAEETQGGKTFTNDELYAYVMKDLLTKATPVLDAKGNKVTVAYPDDPTVEMNFVATPFSKDFSNYVATLFNAPGSTLDGDAFDKLLLHIWFQYDTYQGNIFAHSFYNFFDDKAGFFVRGVWGILKLGVSDTISYYNVKDLSCLIPTGINSGPIMIQQSVNAIGDQSTYILLEGLIAVFLLAYFAILYVWNIVDAYRTSRIIDKTNEIPNQKLYFKEIYEKSFEYLMLLPALFAITFVVIVPIVFSFLVAFTNYDYNNDQFIKWVGLNNFLSLANFAGNQIPFGKEFPKVFGWTMIWAIMSTATVFFSGFLQAVILNNTRVVGRKIWRTFLILPWAVPALISQMVFKIMFNDNGVVNNFLQKIGVNALLTHYGLLGRSISSVHGFWQHLFYLGDSHILWLLNPANATFVKVFLITINIWLGFPFFMALTTGVMTGIDKTLYEAAEIDGATSYNKFKLITFPLVISSTAPLLVMTFSGNFNNFGVIYFITGGGTTSDASTAFAGQTDILISWIYNLTVTSSWHYYDYASVFSILIFLVVGTLATWNYTRMKAFKED